MEKQSKKSKYKVDMIYRMPIDGIVWRQILNSVKSGKKYESVLESLVDYAIK